MRGYDAWLTTQPEAIENVIVCQSPECGEGSATEISLLVDALKWEEESRRPVPVWGCSGYSEIHYREGYMSDCGEVKFHEPHEEFGEEITYVGMCPLCGEKLTYTVL